MREAPGVCPEPNLGGSGHGSILAPWAVLRALCASNDRREWVVNMSFSSFPVTDGLPETFLFCLDIIRHCLYIRNNVDLRKEFLVLMNGTDRYPYSLKMALQQSQYENILDANMFSAYIPRDMDIFRLEDPRKTKMPNVGRYRQPGYVHSTHINQIFSYIGFIKRVQNRDYRKYLPCSIRNSLSS